VKENNLRRNTGPQA